MLTDITHTLTDIIIHSHRHIYRHTQRHIQNYADILRNTHKYRDTLWHIYSCEVTESHRYVLKQPETHTVIYIGTLGMYTDTQRHPNTCTHIKRHKEHIQRDTFRYIHTYTHWYIQIYALLYIGKTQRYTERKRRKYIQTMTDSKEETLTHRGRNLTYVYKNRKTYTDTHIHTHIYTFKHEQTPVHTWWTQLYKNRSIHEHRDTQMYTGNHKDPEMYADT